jgi:IS5 family transposase
MDARSALLQQAAVRLAKPFGHMKVRYRGLVKNSAHLKAFFILSNL